MLKHLGDGTIVQCELAEQRDCLGIALGLLCGRPLLHVDPPYMPSGPCAASCRHAYCVSVVCQATLLCIVSLTNAPGALFKREWVTCDAMCEQSVWATCEKLRGHTCAVIMRHETAALVILECCCWLV
jgi:hypothetical protein